MTRELGEGPNKMWLEYEREKGLVSRRGWINRRIFPPPREASQFKKWADNKFAWGTARYVATGVRPVVKAAYGHLTVTLFRGRLYGRMREARTSGKQILQACKSNVTLSERTSKR